jgi:hypothetical protein
MFRSFKNFVLLRDKGFSENCDFQNISYIWHERTQCDFFFVKSGTPEFGGKCHYTVFCI